MSNHTVGHRYLKAIALGPKAQEDLLYLQLMPEEERQLLLGDPNHSPPIHWTVGACREIDANPLEIQYGDQYLLRGFLGSAGSIVDDQVLRSADMMVDVADDEGWSWQKRDHLWKEQAEPIFARISVMAAKPISVAQWRRASREYDAAEFEDLRTATAVTEQSGSAERPSGSSSTTETNPRSRLCSACGNTTRSPICPNCRTGRTLEEQP